MRRVMNCTILALCCFAFVVSSVSADVVIRLPNGQVIVVPAPVNVQVTKPGVIVEAPFTKVVVNKTLPLPDAKKTNAAEPPLPLPRTVTKVNEVAMTPSDFAKTFKPSSTAAEYEVLFQHPVSDIPVTVTFSLPAGTPQVSFSGNVLRFDYGQGRVVVVNFEDGSKVMVSQR